MEFPGVKALDDVHLTFYSGKVNALLGENGAGKSTLLNILSGVYTSYTGTIVLDDKIISFASIKESQNAGIAIIHQELSLVPNLSIWENVFLGKELLTKYNLLDKATMRNKAATILKQIGLSVSVDTIVGDLKVSQQQLIEIAKAILSDAQIILMDEPTSALDESEVANLHRLIKSWKENGKTIVYISHKMDEMFAIADVYSVLRDGKAVYAGEMSNTSMDALVSYMVGRSVNIEKRNETYASNKIALSIQSLCLKNENKTMVNRLDDITFNVRKGEIVGIYGLMGAGRTELLETIFGLHAKQASLQMEILGQPVVIQSPKDAIAHQLAFVTEDRKKDGLILNQSMLFNYTLTQLKPFDLLNDAQTLSHFETYRSQLKIKSISAHQLTGTLSGGNQQKVVLAKWLGTNPAILLMDEPTRGIDISAKDEMYALMKQMAREGLAIVFASSEIPEIVSLSDRVLVMAGGKIAKELVGESINEKDLLYAALPKERV